jgi:UDP-N-acetylmuramoyl-tripeptide--D-alanyl-D-alanine ligase
MSGGLGWSAERVAQALGVPVQGGVEFSEISTDTRTLRPGALFVALQGERFDGHDHLAVAERAGAVAAVVRAGTPPAGALQLIEVPDTLRAYGELARERRRAIPGPVVAIGGANGKTSTKEMCAAVLRTRFRVMATPANDNNLVGVPKTILAAPGDTEALVIEAGASIRGELAQARLIIDPTVTVTTNVVASHLNGFGSLDGVLQEELDLLDGCPLAIVGPEPPALAAGARKRARRVVVAGIDGAERMPGEISLDANGHATMQVGGERILLPVIGRHQAGNAMLAWVLAEELGLDSQSVAEALRSFRIPGGRGEVLEAGGYTILNDAYNANPASFRAAIETARAMRGDRRLVFVAGTMRELGPESARFHQEVAAELVALQPDLLAGVGEFVPALAPYADSFGDRLLSAPDAPSLGPVLAGRLHGGELIVLKASRGVALERILPYLTGQDHSTH